MKTHLEFRQYFNEHIAPEIEVLEVEREDAVQKIYKIIPATAAGFCIASFIWYKIFPEGAGWFWILFLGGLVCGAIYFVLIDNYVKHFKENVIKKIVKFISPNLNYKPESKISVNDFNHSQIFKYRCNIYEGDDHVYGKMGDTMIAFSEVHASHRVSRDKTKPLFDGLFFVADFNKQFHSRTFVLPDKAERMLGQVGTVMQKMDKSRGELIKLEDPVFEQLFAVYGTNQIEARYILSTSLMERIVEFKRKSCKDISMSFIDSRVYVAIPYKGNLFEPKVFDTLLGSTDIETFFNDLSLAVGIVEDLSLNTRIWTKV